MSSGGGTTKVDTTPWAGAQPYLLDIMQQAQNTYYGGAPGAGGAAGGGAALTPGMQLAQSAPASRSPQFGTLGFALGGPIGGFIGQNLFEKNAPAIDDIRAALARGETISDASWRQAGFGPGGAALNGGSGVPSNTAMAGGLISPVVSAALGAQQQQGGQPGGMPPLGSPPSGTTGSTYASQFPGLSDTTQQALELTKQRALAGSPLLQTAQNTVQNFAGGGATQNPYLDQMFGRAAERVRDMTNSSFTLAGRRGTTTNQDVLSRNLGDLAGQMYGSAYESGQNRQLAAAQLAPGLANQDYFGLQQLLGAGQAYDQYNLDRYNAPWQNLSNYSGILTGFGGMGGSKTEKEPSQSILPSLLGIGLQAGLPYLLSDRRAKTLIAPIGKTRGGHNVYSFRYAGSGDIAFGIMADEIEPKIPDAVIVDSDGYKRVNYAMVN